MSANFPASRKGREKRGTRVSPKRRGFRVCSRTADVRFEGRFFRPAGASSSLVGAPTAYAVGCTLAPLPRLTQSVFCKGCEKRGIRLSPNVAASEFVPARPMVDSAGVSFAPPGLVRGVWVCSPRLAPWAAFFRSFGAGASKGCCGASRDRRDDFDSRFEFGLCHL
jgi:hypothetical protein